MELEKICITGISNTYAISNVRKEFRKAVDEPWKDDPPWERYQQKLIEDLAVLEQEKERAIDLQQFEKLKGVDRLYSIRHPESKKNVRVIYTIEEGAVILLTAFLEKNSGDYQKAKKRLKSDCNGLMVKCFYEGGLNDGTCRKIGKCEKYKLGFRRIF